MNKKILSFVLLLLVAFIANSFVVKADALSQPITASKTVKVNKTTKVYKTLKIKKDDIKNYTITSSNTSVASVTSAGVIKGQKKGNAVITLTDKTNGTTYATVQIKVKNNYTKKQLRLMSAIIFSEAGAECYAGKKAVGIVIMNRVKSGSFPNSLDGVIYQPHQFGPVKNGSLNRSLSLYDSGKLSKQCIKAAKETLNGDKSVSYNGRAVNMHDYLFFSGYVSGCRLQIQNHQFK